jgi:hypothetical protein
MIDKTWFDIVVMGLGGVGIFAVLRSKVDTHHKVLFGDHGELMFTTKGDCKDKHAEDLAHLCRKITALETQISVYQTAVNANTEMMSKILNRIMETNGNRAYDPKQ